MRSLVETSEFTGANGPRGRDCGRIEVKASSNGHGTTAWADPWTHLRVDRPSARHCRVTFDNPPANTVTATTVAELSELVDLIEHDEDLKVVVFDSSSPDVYLGDHALDDLTAWHDALDRLAGAAVVSIASIRGCVGGAGREFALACDLRFAGDVDPEG